MVKECIAGEGSPCFIRGPVINGQVIWRPNEPAPSEYRPRLEHFRGNNMSENNTFKMSKKREGRVNVTPALEESKDKEDDTKDGTPTIGNPANLDTVVLTSLAEEACPSVLRTEGKVVPGKRSRATTYPGATSSSSSDFRPPPQAKRKMDARVKKRIPFTSEDDSKEDSNHEEVPESTKGKRLDRQARRDNREKKIAEMAANAEKLEEKNRDPADVLNRCPIREECWNVEVYKLGDIVREMISEVDNLRGK